ncbi:hypothetical protein H632_c1421p0 [Helicosporidium sp. ATCC 50920]|nr:hypothetical protein H632_c1421p0 [Helicosporidium sp. ATCC 50920]|eukprot:KDD74298.1 hypothetical protein H632_c1421p0 [Helicosporidium sp. ATCC 50920]
MPRAVRPGRPVARCRTRSDTPRVWDSPTHVRAFGGGRYRVVAPSLLPRTWICFDESRREECLVSHVSLSALGSWRPVEEQSREAEALRRFRARGLFEFGEAIEQEAGGDCAFVLVRRGEPGRAVQDRTRAGWRPTEDQLRAVAVQLLEVLDLVARRGGVWTHPLDAQSVRLTDDGTAKLPGAMTGGTEEESAAAAARQMLGLGLLLRSLSEQAGLGAGSPARAMPPDLRWLLDACLQGAEKERPTPAEALERMRLLQNAGFSAQAPALVPRPLGLAPVQQPAACEVRTVGPRLEIVVPPERDVHAFAFGVAWTAFTAFWTVSAWQGGGVLFALFSLPFWTAGVSLLAKTLRRPFVW